MASSGRLVGTIHAAVEDEAVSLSREVPSTTPTRKRKYTGITSRPTTKSRGPDPKAPGITSTSKRTMAPITLPTVVRPSKKMDTVPITQTKDNGEKRIKTEEGAAATEPPKEKQASKATVKSDYNEVVFIYVGPDVKSRPIHKGLLVKASTFFRDVLSNDYTPNTDADSGDDVEIISHDASTKAVALVKEDLAIFDRFNEWLYTKKINTIDETPKDLSWTTIIDTYTFAVRRGIPRLQNSCIDVAIEKVQTGGLFPRQDVINPLWEVTGPVSPLRSLFLQIFAAKCNLKKALASNQGYCQRFLHDLVVILYEMKMEGKKENKGDFWKARRMWHVNFAENPIAID